MSRQFPRAARHPPRVVRSAGRFSSPFARPGENRPGAALHGLLPDFTTGSLGFRDNVLDISRTGYRERSQFANVYVQTDATQISLEFYTTIRTNFPAYAHIVTEVPGYGYAVANSSVDNATNTVTITLPGTGLRTVRVTDGLTSAVSGVLPVKGTWIRRITPLNGSTLDVVPQPQTPGARWWAYGDSITAGQPDPGGIPARESYAARFRQTTGVPVTVEAYGFRSLHDDYIAARFDALVQRARDAAADCTSGAGVTLYLAIGTNDFGLSRWTRVSDFQAAYLELLTELRAALPLARIVAQSPLARTDTLGTTDNGQLDSGLGRNQTIADFRTAVQNAVTAFADSNTFFLSGTAISSGADIGDGVHPSSAGHARIFRRIWDLYGTGYGSLFSAGPFSAANLLQTAAGADPLPFAAGTTLVVQWYQRATSAANDPLVSAAQGVFGSGSGFVLIATNGTGALGVLRYPSSIAVLDTAVLGSVGWHSIAVSDPGAGSLVASIDGKDPVTVGINAYVAPSNARVELGSYSGGSLYNANADVASVALLPFAATANDCAHLASWLQKSRTGLFCDAALKRFDVATDYDPAAASSPGTGLTFTRVGTVPRTAR